jgi:acylphosphatase
MIRMIRCTIWNLENGKKKVIKSGDNKAWNLLDKEEKYWLKYLAVIQNPELYAKFERVLNTNNKKYIPVYEDTRTRK